MALNLTKKTYYILGMLGVACSMASAIASFSGYSFALLGQLTFFFTALMLGFLASTKGTPKAEKRDLTICLVVLIFSVLLNVPLLGFLLSALVWPLFARYQQKKDDHLTRAFQSICAMQAVWFVLRVLALLGKVDVLRIPANLAGLVCSGLNAWLLLLLYRRYKNENA